MIFFKFWFIVLFKILFILRINSLGFKGYDDPPEIVSYIKQYINHEKLFERALKKKISMFYEALNWSFPVEKEYTLERFF